MAPTDGTGACPVKFMSMRSEANFTGVLGMKWVKKYALGRILFYSEIIIVVTFDMSLL